MADALKRYREKRDFARTPEPAQGGEAGDETLAFVIQKHWASRLHYDFRLELDGTLKSWAVPKGPSYDPSVKRMAVQVEDHPIAYKDFEGDIPKGEYGAGKVIVWDEGRWIPQGDPRAGYADGHLKFRLHGHKMQGLWALIRMKGRENERQPPWLLIKDRDDHARSEAEFSVVDEMPDSVRANGAPVSGSKPGSATRDRVPGRPAALPDRLQPQLATLAEGMPARPADWLYELKFDGYRILTRLEDGEARLITRNGHDWSARMPELAQALSTLDVPSAWLDGEIVVLGDDGTPSFQALQNAFEGDHGADIVYYLFDMPFISGRDIRGEPLQKRRDWLQMLVDRNADTLGAKVRFSAAFDAPPDQLISSACRMGLEGIIAKRRESAYVSRRSEHWLKLKCAQRQEFVIVGYTAPKGARKDLGALLLAVHDAQGALRYAGKVGTGFDTQTLRDLAQRLEKIRVPDSPLDKRAGAPRDASWVEPLMLAEVTFGEWTQSGHIRHAVFRGLREDKPVRAIVREDPVPAARIAGETGDAAAGKAPRKPSGRARGGSTTRLTHPDRTIDPSTGLTKLALARYYGLVAPLLLPHLQGRPVSFARAPAGIEGERFFQKHLEHPMAGVRSLPEALYPDHPALIEVGSREGILSAAQMNVVEFHTWNALASAIDTPDRMVFDLDPGEGVQWATVRQAAELVHTLLDELRLQSWLKTSGGKGLHVVVPLQPEHGWDTVKGFSQGIVQHLARTLPQIFVAKSGPRNRVGKIFADYLRNGFGATTVSAWSARTRPGLPISVPLRWDELPELKSSAQWTIENAHTRLDVGNGAWADYRAQTLGAAMKTLGYEPARDEG